MKSFVAAFLILLSLPGFAQQENWLDLAMRPFWKGKTMYNESVMMISKDGAPAEAKLLFKPKKIISVKNSALNIEYKRGVDWEYRNGRICLLPGSGAVSLSEKEMFPDTTSLKTFPRKGGGKLLFREGTFFHDHQLAVTYTHRKNAWKGLVYTQNKDALPISIGKLQKKEALHLLLYGDSISEGYNASGKFGVEPNLPDWGMLVAETLRRQYRTSVTFTNTAVAGQDSKWGKNNAQKLVTDHQPDLVMIAFGMNDGTGKMSPEKFGENISAIIANVRAENPKAEFILVSTTLPNPESTFLGTQLTFGDVLKKMAGEGIAYVDMTTVHAELLKHKDYPDMTGNNINHPNDFLMRWYAQQVAGLLLP
ncbi:hypothetical protein DYBT9275_00172 [Dyadobacter sp. CECT 9275]|uniref:SGNH hydrolase-type esterase domain-containing protein n=1 Tax=Dyadobacter helix TaxID=2822344 RepID=A0A916J7H0_9BACT|nr:SGNH/GDSL hydrolase family protein [Dyadobacter sp. CECT 9275]CAG4988850.1 hypothetical protein DYBT9275_00172 [Dyadobacter sp. CECT 9275]